MVSAISFILCTKPKVSVQEYGQCLALNLQVQRQLNWIQLFLFKMHCQISFETIVFLRTLYRLPWTQQHSFIGHSSTYQNHCHQPLDLPYHDHHCMKKQTEIVFWTNTMSMNNKRHSVRTPSCTMSQNSSLK